MTEINYGAELKRYAELVGKTVEELTVSEKQTLLMFVSMEATSKKPSWWDRLKTRFYSG
jgi:hypothetical protein